MRAGAYLSASAYALARGIETRWIEASWIEASWIGAGPARGRGYAVAGVFPFPRHWVMAASRDPTPSLA